VPQSPLEDHMKKVRRVISAEIAAKKGNIRKVA
jgi:hypothetical protein